MLVYCLPLVFGYISDVWTGRWNMIIYGVMVCGVAHVILVGAAAPALLVAGHATAPFLIGLYILAIGAGTYFPSTTSEVLGY